MAITLPKFGIKTPSETTEFANLGKELRELGQTIETVLSAFNYTGKDPNLVLSRTASLEALTAALQSTATAVDSRTKDTGWTDLKTYMKAGYRGTLRGRKFGPITQIEVVTSVSTSVPDGLTVLGTLPGTWCPAPGAANARASAYLDYLLVGMLNLTSGGELSVIQRTGGARLQPQGSLIFFNN